jgi:hypothetical protein
MDDVHERRPRPGQLAEDPGRGEELRTREQDGDRREPRLQVQRVREEEAEEAGGVGVRRDRLLTRDDAERLGDEGASQ